MQELDEDLIVQLSTRISLALHMTGILEDADEATIEHAREVTRGEFLSMLRGEGEYLEAMQGLEDGTVPEGRLMILVAGASFRKISKYRKVAGHMEMDSQ